MRVRRTVKNILGIAIIGILMIGLGVLSLFPSSSETRQQSCIEYVASYGDTMQVYRYIDELGQRTDFVVVTQHHYTLPTATTILRQW